MLTLLGWKQAGVLGLGYIEHPVGKAAGSEGAVLCRDFVDAAAGTDSGLVGIEIEGFDQAGSGASAIAERLEGRAWGGNMESQDQAYESGEKDADVAGISGFGEFGVVQHSLYYPTMHEVADLKS